MAPILLWFENNGAQIDMQSFFWGHFFEVFFGQVCENSGKIPLHPQKFACSYTYGYVHFRLKRFITAVVICS